MIIVDTSIWIDHFHQKDGAVIPPELLIREEVGMHPLVYGELACGSLRDRSATLRELASLHRVSEASHAEALTLVEGNRLFGKGLSFVDAHLLASALIGGHTLWTRDKALASVAKQLGVAYRR